MTKVKILLIGVPNLVFPKKQEVIDGDMITLQQVLDKLINDKYKYLADILYKDGKLGKEFSVLINGSNVLLLPEKFNTTLNNGDEIIITVQITGG